MIATICHMMDAYHEAIEAAFVVYAGSVFVVY